MCSVLLQAEECLDYTQIGHRENDRKLLDTWLADLFFNRQALRDTWDRNALLHAFECPRRKLRFIGELFAQYMGKKQNIPEALVTLREAVRMKDTMAASYCVDEDEVSLSLYIYTST